MTSIKDSLQKKHYALLLISSGLLTGVLLAIIFGQITKGPSLSAHPYLAKRILVDNPNDVIFNFSNLKKRVNDSLDSKGISYGFYFEYLPTGTSMKIAENEVYVGASLIKLPLVMNLYRAQELGKLSLSDSITLQPSWIDKGSGDLWQAGAGARIPLSEAANLSLTKSDNTAAWAVRAADHGKLTQEQDVFSVVDIGLAFDQQGQDYISAKSYSEFLKCLYFSCYLNKADSEEILTMLTQTVFGGIPDGIPANVEVAHKVGFYEGNNYSDCGIVYVPKRPYALCLMMKSTRQQYDSTIKEVSKIAYEEVTHQNPTR